MKKLCLLVAVFAAYLSHPVQQSSAEAIFVVTTGNTVNVVDSANPTVTTRSGAITGLAGGENVIGIDYRANGGGLYVIGDQSNVYTLNPNNFALSQLGSTLGPALVGGSFAYDFNPSAAGGVLSRIISGDTNNNRVIDSTTGGYFGTPDKTPVFYDTGDANEGANPNIQGIAYDNNVLGATATQQFGIDASLGILTTVANNAGTLSTIGSLGLAPTPIIGDVGFDISGLDGTAYAAINSMLYTIDLGTGAATLASPGLGLLGGTGMVRDITVVPASAVPEPSSLAVLAISGIGMVYGRRKRRR